MRNLKRVLSLALASTMLLGMMVMGAGAAEEKKVATAADLSDMGTVVNKEAVTLLVDLKVIAGKTDGTYAPTETVNRATMARLLTALMMGADVDQNTFKGTVTDLTDVDGHWAEGYIKYCYSTGIILGDGQGHFFPDQPITTAAAAKMLLVAIGRSNSDFAGTNWSSKAMSLAASTRTPAASENGTGAIRPLTKGLSVKANDPLTRDSAAQMIFNTLFVATQVPKYQWDNGIQYIQEYTAAPSLGQTNYGDPYRVTGALTAVGTNGTATINSKSVKLSAKGGDIGSNVVYYTAGKPAENTVGTVISTAAVASATNVLATSMDGTSYTDVLTAPTAKGFVAEENKVENAIKVLYYINGTEETGTGAKGAINDASKLSGNIVDLIDNDGDGDIDVVKVIAKSIDAVDGDVQTRTLKGKDQVNVPVTGLGWIGTDAAVGYEDLEDGDVVLYYTAAGVTYFEMAETIEGKVSGSKSTGEIRVNGTYYGFSKIEGAAGIEAVKKSDGTINSTDEFLFGLDNNGSVAYVKAITAEATSATAYVIEAAYVTGGGVNASKYVEVQILLSDGTTDVFTVKKAFDTDGTTALALGNDTNATALKGFLFKYTPDKDGKLTITKLSTTDLNDGDKVTNGKSVIANGTTKVATANSKTVYFVKKGTTADNTTYTAYTGYNAVPSMIAVSGKYVVDSGIAKFVFIDTTAFEGDKDTANYIYLISTAYATETEGDNTYFVYDVIMDGEKVSLSMDEKLDDAVTAGLYKGITLTDEIATASDFAIAINKITGTLYDPTKHSIGNGIVVLGGDKTFTYDDETVVYMIVVGEDGADVTTTSCDRVKLTSLDSYEYTISESLVKSGEELLSALYIVQTDKA